MAQKLTNAQYRKYITQNADDIIISNQLRALSKNEDTIYSTNSTNSTNDNETTNDSETKNDLKEDYLMNYKIKSAQITPVFYARDILK